MPPESALARGHNHSSSSSSDSSSSSGSSSGWGSSTLSSSPAPIVVAPQPVQAPAPPKGGKKRVRTAEEQAVQDVLKELGKRTIRTYDYKARPHNIFDYARLAVLAKRGLKETKSQGCACVHGQR
ncbi:hypothetical protein PENSPDRAFT_694963 [Peniophora sp. CONT]|nr:hypothetical protein PENSPDRAFT_694963 [Peniophora sp. CONT]